MQQTTVPHPASDDLRFRGEGAVIRQFERVARERPEAVALTCLSEDETSVEHQITYGWLNRMANRIARRLQTRGVGAETVVAIAVDRDAATIAATLGILKTGACFLPVDGGLPEVRLKRIVQESGAVALLAMEKNRPLYMGIGADVIVIDECLAATVGDGENVEGQVWGQSPAYVIYTSGSTGEPKGVVVTQAALTNLCAHFAAVTSLDTDDVVLQFATTAFDTAYEEILPCLSRGGRLVLRSSEMGSDITALLSRCVDSQITILDLPTAFWHVLARMLRDEALRPSESVRWIVIGGEEASVAHVRSWREKHGERPRLLNSYGPTESTIVATYCDLGAQPADLHEVPLGSCVAGAAITLCDGDRVCAPGEIGEIHISGMGLARGYVASPRLTAERFIPTRSSVAGAREYRTGDRASRTPSGELVFKGRADHQVKLNGHRIQLEEVEKALLAHPSIAACAVMLRDNRVGGKHLVAYCVLKREDASLPFEASPLSVMVLREFLAEHVPEYMIPGEFSFLEKFILTSTGKIDRSKLPQIGYFDRKYRRLPDYQRPQPGLETRLAAILCEVLDLDMREIGAEDPFEYLGGNSLYSIQVRYKAQQVGLHFKASDLHLRQSVRGLARCCQSPSVWRRVQTPVVDYANYFRSYGKMVLKDAARSLIEGRSRRETRSRRHFERFYSELPDRKDVVYVFFTKYLLHWLSTTLGFAPPGQNIVLIGSGLSEEEVSWVKSRIPRPFLHLEEEIDLNTMWDILFAVNKQNFGWLDVDCFVMNPSIFEEMKRIASDQAINCLWTHAACGPTKRPFHVLESYYLFFNMKAIEELRGAGVMPRPSARSATLRQIEVLKRLIPIEEGWREYFGSLRGRAFTHRVLEFDFAPLILFQLIANASGYKLNRVRLFTEIDSFNPYNYYSDEVIHVFPTIRYFDTVGWWGRNQKFRLSCDYLLMTSKMGQLPPSYQARKQFLEGKFHHFDLDIEAVRAEIREYLAVRGVTDKTFRRPEFAWLAPPAPLTATAAEPARDRVAAVS